MSMLPPSNIQSLSLKDNRYDNTCGPMEYVRKTQA